MTRSAAHHRPVHVVLCLAFVALLARPLSAVADDAPRAVALGESNDAAERAELLAFFGATDATQLASITVDETVRVTGNGFDLSGVDTAYSSAALTCAAPGDGVAVVTRNIQIVPPALYALALVTAGIADVRLAVAAPDADPALGMTALAGVFKAWDAAPCGIGGADAGRRTLALDEVALVARIGQARDGADGVRAMTGAMQVAQMRVVSDGADPKEALTAAAAAAGLALSHEDTADGAAFLRRLSKAGVAWGEFTGGWTFKPGSDGVDVRVSPLGSSSSSADGSAVPTGVGGVAAPTAPARSAVATSTSAPPSTATATPAATATATAAPLHIAGTVRGVDGTGLTITPDGSERPTGLVFGNGATITRSGTAATLGDLRSGDRVTGTVRAGDGRIIALDAMPAPAARGRWISGRRLAAMALALLALLGLLALLLLVGRRRRPRVVTGRVSPAVAAAAVARRRAGERLAVTVPRRFSVRRRLVER